MVALVVTLTGTLRGVASAAAFTILIYYGIANWAALRMPRGAKLFPDLVPLVGMAACVLLALSLSPKTVLTGIVVLLVGVVARFAIVRRTEQGGGPCRQLPSGWWNLTLAVSFGLVCTSHHHFERL